MIKKIFALIVMLCGLGLMAQGLITHYQYKKQEQELLNYIEEGISNGTLDVNEEDDEEGFIEVDVEGEMNFVNEKVNPMGILEIPSIKLKSGIIKGATLSDIKKGIGYYKNTALPSDEYGNFVLAAHNSGRMPIFKNLHKTNIGDEVIVYYANQEYRYVITEKYIVNPTDVDILQGSENVKEITMFTCTNKGEQRYVVKGVSID
ncbi:MAG: class D sortase [Romboutsia sp.]|nr:class D sortase [Romboutsia sp.]